MSDQTNSLFRTLVQSVGIFFLVQFAMRQFLPQQQAGGSSGSSTAAQIPAFSDRPLTLNPHIPTSGVPHMIAPMWPQGSALDLDIYLSPSVFLTSSLSGWDPALHVLSERSFGYGNFSDSRDISASFPVPSDVQNNGTLWAHIFVGLEGAELDPASAGYDTAKAYHFVKPFTQYRAKRRVSKLRNLLASGNETEPDIEPDKSKGPTLASYYHPNFTLSFIPESGTQSFPNMHPGLQGFVQLERTGARDATGQNGWYYPVLFVNTFWQLRNYMTELNDTVTELPLNIHLNNLGTWKYTMMASVEEGMKINMAKAARGESTGPGGDGSEIEEFKRILMDSNMYLLATTGVVSVFHMIFEMLAFKNDVAHWRKKKDNVGTSLRTILANVFMQAIIFLYLLDNNENTSWMILFSQGMGIAIEAWKITKTVNVRVRPAPAGNLLPYRVVFEDKHVLSETEKKTQEYDEIAFKYLYMVAAPLILAYASYSLVYETHKSWYSFIIATLVGSVYAYGFLMMVPSLYINYRLKSVAHMPGKAMMYKFLNTFIDDLFAFTIKMPWLHRLATLRDDVIFFVYLYQSYKYRVDYTRVNEFGQGGVSEDQDGEDPARKQRETKKLPVPAGAERSGAEAAKASGVEKWKAMKRK